MKFGLQVDYVSMMIFRYRAISDSTCEKMAAIFKMAAIAYLKFFDIVG